MVPHSVRDTKAAPRGRGGPGAAMGDAWTAGEVFAAANHVPRGTEHLAPWGERRAAAT